MKIAQNYPNLYPGEDLGIKKLYLLLDVPNDERETFISV